MSLPNLDAESTESLWDLWNSYRHASRSSCELLIGDTRPGYTKIVRSSLANYCANKATAQKLRADGDIQTASMYEGICDRIYSDIPADLRW